MVGIVARPQLRTRESAASWRKLASCALVLLLLCSVPVVAYEAAKNDNNDDNGLGLLARACSDAYCWPGVTALDLWISLEEVCSPVAPQPYMKNLAAGEEGVPRKSQDWSVASTLVVCAGVWTASMYVGFQSGSKIGTQTKGGYPVA